MHVKPVKCVETGQVFDSATAAADWLGIATNTLSAAARGVNPTAGGYHWEYIEIKQEDEPKPKADKPRSAPAMTIAEVQEEARRRTEQTGRYTRYRDIQIEETLRLARNQTTVHKPKRRGKG